jgi:hypothetical protein
MAALCVEKEGQAMSGVLIFQGMKVGFLAGDLSISLNENGEFRTKAILSTAYNVVPIWLRIAHDNLKASKSASETIATQWSEDAEEQKQLLMSELAPSMQVFVACGIGLDALYDTLRPHANISAQEISAWRDNKTARYKQVIEVIRRIYKVKSDTLNDFRECIKQIFKFRDKAVHPSLELQQACTRPDIAVGVDWKFSAYRYSNSKWCLTNTIIMIVYLYEHKSGLEEVDNSVSNIIDALEELQVVSRNA